MIPEKRIIRRIQSGGCAIHCQDCSISQLCIPFTLNEHELDQLDNIIERKKPIQKGQTLFKAGDELKSLYAIRSGTIKSYTITEQGDEQITGFHLAGDLVGFDAIGSGHHPSFAQALETSMVCEIPFETLDDLSGKMPNLRQQMMRLMSGEIKVVWHNRPFEAIIQEVIAGSHDLVLKMAHQHDRLEAVIFTPTDWHLLRKCPSPVWMVKDQPWPEGGKALVAVNLASEEPYHNALNEKLVKETLQLAEQVNHTEVHLVGAYPVTPINIAIELPEFDPSVYNDAIRGQHLLAMKALRQKFSIDEKVTHVEKGLPEEVIPDLAEHLQAGIVVLGTVGRTGLSAAFLGNTAEQVIDHLRCDLLVIKPDEYQTPVELDDEDD